jgi:beta-lactamase regulating signal transducer with metallopeptidase domain
MSTLIRCYPGDRGLDFVLVVTLVVALASSAAWFLARRLAGQAALRHLVLYAALVSCLASPVVACLCSAMGLTLVSIPLLCGEQAGRVTGGSPIEINCACAPTQPSIDVSLPLAELALPPTHTTIDQNRFSACCPEPSQTAVTTTPSLPEVPPTDSPPGTPISFRDIATGVMFVWAAGAVLLLARLAWMCGRVVQLRRSAHPLKSEHHQALLQETAARLGMCRLPLLLVSRRTIAPLAVGFGRPAVILPQRLLGAVSENELRDIFMHELAHLQRSDQRRVLLQGLAGALYWPIVSVHALNRELQRAREEVCDNVVLVGRDAISYGTTLLHVAELLLQARPMGAAVGILGGRGELERRIAGLIDPRRNTMSTTSRKASFFVLFLFLAVGVLLSATRFAASAAPEKDEPQSPVPATRAADAKRKIVLRGKVLGPEDRPIAGARLYLTVDEWTDTEDLGTSDVNGFYRFEVPEKTLRRTTTGPLQYEECQVSLIATAVGFGPAWQLLPAIDGGRYGEMQAEYVRDFHLGDDFPIAGRVVDVKGKPVAGAVVAVDRIHSLTDGRWFKMIPAIRAGDSTLMTRQQTDVNGWFSWFYPTAWQMIPPATTDAEGRFRITGVGADRAIRLQVTGPGVRSDSVSVVTRADATDFAQKVRAKYPRTPRPKGYFYPARSDAPEGDQGVLLFGPSPTIEVDPARTVAGVVRDAATGKPVAGLRVTVDDALGAGSATTDGHGRYRLLRAEADKSIVLVTSQYEERYLTVMRKLTDTQGLGEIVADLEVPRGIDINGRVLETGTDRPIVSAPRQGTHDIGSGPLLAGTVTYYPLSSNTALRGTPAGLYFANFPSGAQNYFRSTTIDGDGRFQLSVPPGPGVLLLHSGPGMPMFAEHSVWKESDGFHRLFPYVPLARRAKEDGAPGGDAENFAGFNGPIPLAHYHAYRIINPAAKTQTLDLTLNIPRAATRVVRFVDPQGSALAGVEVTGLINLPTRIILDGSQAEVLALEPGKPRRLIAFSKDEKYAVRTFVRTDDAQPKTIRLEPTAAVTGRLVDANGKPVQASLAPPRKLPGSDADDDERGIPETRSDAEGRFRIGSLLPGLRYSAEVRGGEGDSEVLGKAFANVVLRAGEVRDVGEIRVKHTVTPKSETTPGN